jgi:hypothetical protein
MKRRNIDITVDFERGAIKIVHEAELPQQDHIGPREA